MTYIGKVINGRVELPPDVVLPEGQVVRIETVPADAPHRNTADDPLVGLGDEAVSTGITDLAAQHDHYTYGSPKRSD